MPPKVALPHSRMLASMQKVLHDQELLERLKEEGRRSKFYDPCGPAVRKRREVAQKNFEYLITQAEGLDNPADVWATDKLLEYCKLYISYLPLLIKGRSGSLPTVSSLWHFKDAIYWHAVRRTPDFGRIYHQWHRELHAHIHMVAHNNSLNTAKRLKFELTDCELTLFWEELDKKAQKPGFLNWYQHYVAWILAYITGSRPGSFTVAPGYSKGSKVGYDGVRPEDETLRWRDIHFRRFEGGIGATVTFHFLKGQRNPYTRNMLYGSRDFTFIPTTGNRNHLDLASLLLGLAYLRGLFVDPWDMIWHDDHVYLRKNPDVDEQAVFVAVDVQGRRLLLDTPMKENALNPKLGDMCIDVGLFQRNTMYSLRRAAISETKRRVGSESARELANHRPDGSSLYAYAHRGFADVDITAFRLQEQGLTTEEVAALFRQAVISRFGDGDTAAGLKETLEARVEEATMSDEAWRKLDEAVENVVRCIRDTLPLDARGWGMNTGTLKAVLIENSENELLEQLNRAVYERKKGRREIRRRLRRSILESIKQEQHSQLRVSGSKANATYGKGAPPKSIHENHQAAQNNLQAAQAQILENVAQLARDADREEAEDEDGREAQNDGDDSDLLEEDELLAGSRLEPEEWEELPEQVEMELDRDDGMAREGTPAERQRALVAGLMNKVALSKAASQTSNLTCFLCQIDLTRTVEEKTRTYTMWKLDAHLKGNTHTRLAQLQRALKAQPGTSVECFVCNKKFHRRKVIPHLQRAHPEELNSAYNDDD
ncbi:uncharacterized protein EI97DRAFT_477460 [Westerdykella ornata]|uniref:Uncharacterized protein n=1 Tax=Westerdykella ornata TaxID=318751 RepID=A0A6A6JTQ5_WESOR|nr:uncharacterized protein EI97DRAFT_477460 [Westerdykella ornata]KAF2279952.1 hypothetical protein EI97DRAFT_477460 [Westerdykella ornata]